MRFSVAYSASSRPSPAWTRDDDRRLVLGELLVIRQVAPEIPHREARDRRRRDPGEKSEKEQKLQKFHGLRAKLAAFRAVPPLDLELP